MTLAHAAAARNTNTAVEGENTMTDEELQKEIQNICESIGNLPESDEALSKEERRNKVILSLKKDILENIKDAREKNERDKELQNTMAYGLLTSLGEKHPYLMSLLQSSLRWSSF